MAPNLSNFDPAEWSLVSSVRNPWGEIPLTAGGRALTGYTRAYLDRLTAQQQTKDPTNLRRHHYVPRAYLKQWSFDGKRVWTADTVTGTVRPLGLKDVCVAEDFYRVVGPDGMPHNRVELLFGVVDAELRRVQVLLDELNDPEKLSLDDLMGLGLSMAIQRMRTHQARRVHLQHDAWFAAQKRDAVRSIDGGAADPHRLAGVHTELLFRAMWDAADVMTTRQIEIWHDPRRRFLTCDAPVLNPFIRNVRPSLEAASYILWPISPRRVVALGRDSVGEKAVIREATGPQVGMVRQAVEQGRERMIFANEDQVDRLPVAKKFRRRTQLRLRCAAHGPDGTPIAPPGCCVESKECYSAGPDVVLCDPGLHESAPAMWTRA